MSSTTTQTRSQTQTQISPTIRFDTSFLTLKIAIIRLIGFVSYIMQNEIFFETNF